MYIQRTGERAAPSSPRRVRAVPDKDDAEPGRSSVPRHCARHASRHLGPQARRARLAVDEPRRHGAAMRRRGRRRRRAATAATATFDAATTNQTATREMLQRPNCARGRYQRGAARAECTMHDGLMMI